MSKFKTLLTGFVNVTKDTIKDLAVTSLPNDAKKLQLDQYVTNWLSLKIENSKLNFFVKILIQKIIVPNISVITQVIFDLSKSKINGVTKC